MKANNLFQQTAISLLALGLLIALLYTNTLNHSELENKLRHLSKQANLLNLKINQTVFSHQLGIKKNYDLLSQQLTELKSIQQALKQLEGKIHRLNHKGITKAIKLFNQQLDNKTQLIESFKSHHALYKKALLSAQFINPSLLTPLVQHSQALIISDNKTRKHVMQISSDKTTLTFDQLEQEISLYYRQEHKKYRAIQNILFLFTLLTATYITLKQLAINRPQK